MRKSSSIKKTLPLLVLTLLSTLISPASADITTAPKGISQSLWTNFRNMVMFDVDSQKRNLRWVTSPGYFVKGNPTDNDVNTLNNTLATIAENCTNIRPGRSAQEPSEGVIFNFVPRAQFKSAIPAIPETVNDSWLYWTYYKNRGITKTDIVIANELADQKSRNYLIRVRVLQAFGFYELSDDTQYSFLSNSADWESNGYISNRDKEMLRFYCSSLVRAWDTEEQTKSYIESKTSSGTTNQFANFTHKIKVESTEYGADLTIYPQGDSIWDNYVNSILLQVQTKQGSIVFSESIDVSQDIFSAREFYLNVLESKKYYDVLIYNKNSAGYSVPQKSTFQTETITTSTIPLNKKSNLPKSAVDEVSDASAAVNDSYEALVEAVEACNLELQTSDAQILKALKEMALAGSCTPILDKGKQVLAATSKIEKVNLNSSQSEINKSIDAWNAATDEMNLLCEEADAKTAEIQDALEAINNVIEQVENIENFRVFIKTDFKKLNTQISMLSAKRKNLISKLEEYVQLKSDISVLNQIQLLIAKYLNRGADIVETSESINGYEDIPGVDNLMISFQIIQDNLPKYSCIKGKLITDFISKCPNGYVKKAVK